jgi:hypothetical protein
MSCVGRNLVSFSLLWASALLFVGVPREARAALGDDVSAVAKDQARLRASLHIKPMNGYAIHELTSPTGTTVREYVGKQGKVFGVSWSGGFRPNLRDLMGSHYDQLIAGSRGRTRARGPVRIELPGMVVVMGGHLRTFWGHAYLTDLAPAGWPAGDSAAEPGAAP